MNTVVRKTLVPPSIGASRSTIDTISVLRAAGMGTVKLKKLRLDWLHRALFDKPYTNDLQIQSTLEQTPLTERHDVYTRR